MIQQVIDFLFTHCNLPDKHNYAINIMTRQPFLIQIFLANGTSIVVKAVDQAHGSIVNMRREYDALSEHSVRYPGFVPKPIVYKNIDHHVILAMEGIRHKLMSLKEILAAKHDVNSQLQKFLAGEERIIHPGTDHYKKQAEVIENALVFLPDYLLPNIQKLRLKHDWDGIIATLPVIPQHGDLATNNVGLTTKRIILFDWENYAIFNIPGFDLCIMLVSGCEFNVSRLVSVIDADKDTGTSKNPFLQKIMVSIGINVPQLFNLIMINLILFYQIKREHGYGKEIVRRTDNMLDQLATYLINKY
jgi:hypothetical protein